MSLKIVFIFVNSADPVKCCMRHVHSLLVVVHSVYVCVHVSVCVGGGPLVPVL